MDSHLILSKDLAYLREDEPDSIGEHIVSPVDPDTFIQKAIEQAQEIHYTPLRGQKTPSDANQFRDAMGGTLPSEVPASPRGSTGDEYVDNLDPLDDDDPEEGEEETPANLQDFDDAVQSVVDDAIHGGRSGAENQVQQALANSYGAGTIDTHINVLKKKYLQGLMRVESVNHLGQLWHNVFTNPIQNARSLPEEVERSVLSWGQKNPGAYAKFVQLYDVEGSRYRGNPNFVPQPFGLTLDEGETVQQAINREYPNTRSFNTGGGSEEASLLGGDVPQPENEREEYISHEDEEKFISYLREVYQFVNNEQQTELGKPDTDRLYIRHLTDLMHLVDQLEATYEQPGVVSMNQHIANVRRLEREVERTLEAKPRDQEPPVAAAAEVDRKYLGGEPAAPEAPTPPEAPVEAPPAASDRDGGKFVSQRDPAELDRMADLIYRSSYGMASADDAQDLESMRVRGTAELRAGRRRWKNLQNRLHKLNRHYAVSPEKMTPDQTQELRDLKTRFPAAVTESFFQSDPVIRHLYEALDATRMSVDRHDPTSLLIFTEPTGDSPYFTLKSRNSSGWFETNLVQEIAATPEPATEPDAATSAIPHSREIGDMLRRGGTDPDPEPTPTAAEPTPTAAEPEPAAPAAAAPAAAAPAEEPEELTPEEQEVAYGVESVIKEFESGSYDVEDMKSQTDEIYWDLISNLSLRRKRPEFQAKLREIRRRIETQDQPQKHEPGPEFEQILDRATKWRTGWKWWGMGLRDALNRIKLSGGYNVTKSRDARQGAEYAINSPAFPGKIIYVWVPKQTPPTTTPTSGKNLKWPWQRWEHLNISPDLQHLFEQDIDVSADPKGEAPPEAFGIPPVPPGMTEPEGGAGEEGPPEAPGEEPAREIEAPEAKPGRIVVTQNNVWWELSWDNWVQFLVLGASAQRWDLDHWGARYPEGKPTDIRDFVTLDRGPTYHYSTQPDTNVYRVKSWSPDRFRKELDYVQAMDVAGLSLVEPKPPAEDSKILSTS